MLIRYFFSLMLVFTFGPFTLVFGQKEVVKKRHTLTHELSPEDQALFYTLYEKTIATDPPPGEVFNVAEYEKMESVLIAYPGNFGLPVDLIATLSEEINVITLVENNAQLDYVTGFYSDNGVNMDQVQFMVTDVDSYWTRDYGPWFVRYGEEQIGMVDFIYNRPSRPNDNAIPSYLAGELATEWFGMDLITAGGNYMTDGYRKSSSSDLVWDENPLITPADIDQLLETYCGVDEYYVLADPNNTYIDHIDCWGKFLDVDKVLIRAVPEFHPQYDEIEATATFFSSQPSAWGHPYEVIRVWTPNNEPYSNSLIVNDRVFVPMMGGPNDEAALETYAEAMPGYEILGFAGAWESTDALHCRTKGMADRDMLYITHFPLLGIQPEQSGYLIEAELTAYSGHAINPDNVWLHYWVNENEPDSMLMIFLEDQTYQASLPSFAFGSKVSYYLSASDLGNHTAMHPLIGAPDPHVFYVGDQLLPNIELNLASAQVNAPINDSANFTFTVSNTGTLPLTYQLEPQTAVTADLVFALPDGPDPNTWNDNTLTEMNWTVLEVNNTPGEMAGLTLSFDWNVDQYVNESTLYIESPSGTQSVLAAGIPDGNYSLSTSAFDGEPLDGTWTIWITDSYGDGGHQATNVSLTLTRSYTLYEWLSLEPIDGTVQPEGSATIEALCDATALPAGVYEGSVLILSNDPDSGAITLPVEFTVDDPTGLEMQDASDFDLQVYPNPFSESVIFLATLRYDESLILDIYTMDGRRIKRLSATTSRMHLLHWDGKDSGGQAVAAGVYYYKCTVGETTQAGKLIFR